VIEILQCLKKYGQRLDSEIAIEMGIPLATVHKRLTGLAVTGVVITCNLTRFENGKRIEDLVPGRKARSLPEKAKIDIQEHHVQQTRRSAPG
jgi:DNA-binding Lrp family transcriptional regulator